MKGETTAPLARHLGRHPQYICDDSDYTPNDTTVRDCFRSIAYGMLTKRVRSILSRKLVLYAAVLQDADFDLRRDGSIVAAAGYVRR